MHAIGIDIGGTKVAGALVTEEGDILRLERRPTPAGDPAAIIDVVVELVRELGDGHEVIAAGIAAAGFIDVTQSTVYYAPNINWRSEPLRDRLSARLPGLDITVDNDANAAGWAEYRFGAGRGTSDMTMLTIGTGVGGAIVTDGRLLRGGFGAAGEIGHLRVVPGGHPCGCGQKGCIEQYGSGRALLRFAGGIADAGGIGQSLAERREANGGVLDGTIVAQLIQDGDPGALAALRELGDWLGQACA
ncbi:MAG TPA: ROK family protein, partial [Pseudolysinimonas sp.]|nr:ROK family protein [Pseudolysinimonas sp.]